MPYRSTPRKAIGVFIIGIVESLINIAWCLSDAVNSLGTARLALHIGLAILAAIQVTWSWDIYQYNKPFKMRPINDGTTEHTEP
jgi:hypothetical protein